MHELHAILRVLIVGLILGAGLPALFAIGMRAYTLGETTQADGTMTGRPNPVGRVVGWGVFALVAIIVAIGLLWVCHNTIKYYTGVDLFPFIHAAK